MTNSTTNGNGKSIKGTAEHGVVCHKCKDDATVPMPDGFTELDIENVESFIHELGWFSVTMENKDIWFCPNCIEEIREKIANKGVVK